jgi:DNA-binding protein HU-beta
MTGGNWRIAGMLAVPVAVAALAGCSNGGGQPAATSATQATVKAGTTQAAGAATAKAATAKGGAATAKADSAKAGTAKTGTAKSASAVDITAAMLKNALLTHVNGAAAAGPATSGKYSSLPPAKLNSGNVQVNPKACSTAVTQGFNPTALAGNPAAAVTFRVGNNGVTEVLIASTAQAASSVLAGQVPAGCSRYQETVQGKTFTYGVTEQPVTGVGTQAKALNVQAKGPASDNLWSLIYRGNGFVGMITVVGPNTSEKAAQALGKQAYAYATKTLS